MSAERDYYTVDEIRRKFRFRSAETVRRMIKRGDLKAVKVCGEWRVEGCEYQRLREQLRVEV